jgi:prepilin-type N-terminal cleavage/methylation domain-containing protein
MNHTQNNQNNRLELNHGYTLIEVLIAMAIFAIGILAIFSMQITSTGSNALARGLTENYTAAMDKVEELLALPYDDPDLDPDASPLSAAKDSDGIDNDGDGFIDDQDLDGEDNGYIDLSWQVWENTIHDQRIKSVRVTVSSMVNGGDDRDINIDFYKANM